MMEEFDLYDDCDLYDEDYEFDSYYYEDDDNLEMGFDPYMGCYTDDC